jgi:glycosyltransferase involved in cell wall biosynthesis
VGIDATSWTNRRGYGRFARNAVTRLVEIDQDTRYVLYTDEQSAPGVELPEGVEQRRVALRRSQSQAIATSSRRPGDLLRLMRAARGRELDAFLFPSVYTYFPVPGVPTVVGVHDAIADSFPELTLPNRRAQAFWHAKEWTAVRLAGRLFTVSESARAALVDRFGLAPERLAVVPEAPDPAFSPRPDADVARALAQLGLTRGSSFFLFAGGISPHKNIETLLGAYAALRSARTDVPSLIIVGDLESNAYLSSASTMRDQIARLGLAQLVFLPGFVSDETLACLYSGATAVVLPSLAEGFGLPAVEAAACGAPTILSDLAAHRETLGDAALFFPPTDATALTQQLSRILDDAHLRQRLAEQGPQAVSRYSWDTAAERLQDLIIDAASRRTRRRAGGNGWR